VLKEILVIDKTDNIRHADQNITQILPSNIYKEKQENNSNNQKKMITLYISL